jgi:hypothetical protein
MPRKARIDHAAGHYSWTGRVALVILINWKNSKVWHWRPDSDWQDARTILSLTQLSVMV